jgi:hypothetical protein
MTAQATDTFYFKGKAHELIGLEGTGLFSPEAAGMVPEMLHTACYRGFICTYKIKWRRILLHELIIREASGNYRPVNGVLPAKDCSDDPGGPIAPGNGRRHSAEAFTATYKDLKMPVPFTGKLRLARGFISDFYVHMGYQKPTAFRTVYDLTFDAGKMIELNDRSAEVERKRGAFKARYESNRGIEAIEDAFSLDMDLE